MALNTSSYFGQTCTHISNESCDENSDKISRVNDNIDFNDNDVNYDDDKVKVLNTVSVSNKTDSVRLT